MLNEENEENENNVSRDKIKDEDQRVPPTQPSPAKYSENKNIDIDDLLDL